MSSHIPWYRNPTNLPHPFHLASTSTYPTPLKSVACFPWNCASFLELWDGQLPQDGLIQSDWDWMIAEHMGKTAVGGKCRADIRSLFGGSKSISIVFDNDEFTTQPSNHKTPNTHIDEQDLQEGGSSSQGAPQENQEGTSAANMEIRTNANYVHVAWALNYDKPFEPLLLLSCSGLLYVYSIEKEKLIAKFRGHGGEITSIAVHRLKPHLFCTTSRDFTTRLYDLTLPPLQKPQNPCWPPDTTPSHAGAPNGLHSISIAEDVGMGRCVAIFAGGHGILGGHASDVLCADFHPTLPVLATGGMDRAIVIWRIPPAAENHIAKEYKPLFSNAIMHRARVLSISWLSEDILLTHCSATFIRRPENKSEKQNIPGSIILLQWDGLNTYFPPEHRDNLVYPMHGVAADTEKSSSYRILSRYELPILDADLYGSSRQTQYSPHLSVFRTPTHDPILLYACGNIIYFMNVSQMEPNPPPESRNPFITTASTAGGESSRREVPQAKSSRAASTQEESSQGGSSQGNAVPVRRHEHNLEKGAWKVVTAKNREVIWGCCMAMESRLLLAAGDELSAWALQ